MEQQDIIMERNADRKERLLDIAERIGYDTAISRLQQKLSENQAALTKQNVPLDSSNFAECKLKLLSNKRSYKHCKSVQSIKNTNRHIYQKSISGE